MHLLSTYEVLGPEEGRDTSTSGKGWRLSEGTECSQLEGTWLRREEASGSERKDPEGTGRLQVQESCLVRSHGCSVTSSIPEPGDGERRAVRTPASLLLL